VGDRATTCPFRSVNVRHRIKHHVNRPVLHWGLFTDAQMLPASGLFAIGAGWLYAGSGGVLARALVTALVWLPVGVMVVDNRVGGVVVTRAQALVRWHRMPGVFDPGVDDALGYELSLDAEDRLMLERDAKARVDLEAVFAGDVAAGV
jgi:hypothetical protein